jgi:hypothetical protein
VCGLPFSEKSVSLLHAHSASPRAYPCVAYFDPKSESRIQRAQRLEREAENVKGTNGPADNKGGGNHENTW